MDANGTRYHLLMGRDDWGACRLGGPDGTNGPTLSEVWAGEGTPDAGLAWDCERSELRLASRAFLFTQPGAGRPPRLADRRGAARDRHGTWYWIAPNGQEILVRSAGSNTVTHFWSATDVSLCMVSSVMGAFAPDTIAPPPAPLTLQGLAITVDNFLVVGTLKPGGLLLFDLFSGGPPAQLVWPVAWEPFDVSSRPGGGVWVLERRPGSGAGPAWIWEIDRQFRVVPPAGTAMPPVAPASGAFTPGSLGESVRDGDRVISRDDARPHQGSHPVAIEGLRDGTVLVVDSDPAVGFSRVWRYGQGEPTSIELVGTSDLERLVRPQDRATFALRAIDAAVVPAVVGESGQPGTDRLYVVSQSGNQAFAFDLTLESGRFTLRMREQYLPLRLFGGKGLVATDDVLPSYDLGDQWLPLVEQRRPLYAESAVLTTPMPADDEPAPTRPPLDGRVPDCTWHRLMLDACFPPDTGVLVESRAANDLETLRTASWQREPPPYLRRAGSEIPFQPTRTAPGDGTWELLFQRAKGRYLSLRLTVYGTGTSTPRIRAIRAWYPRFSYLEHYLPDVYRDCDSPAFFLDRYLANLEGIATGIEDRIAQVQMLFDVRSAPAETLQWLAGWYDLVLDPAWDERRRRLLIDHAMTFFQWRGTTHGLELALKLALDACVDERAFASPDMPPDPGHPRRPESFRIVESFLRRVGSRVLDVVDPEAEIAMAPAVMDPDLLDRWRAFLKRRYRQIGALNQAHRRFGTSAWTSFDTVRRIGAGDPGGAEPGDWRAFQDDVVTAGGLAHRFTVLLPGRDETPEQQQERASLVRRVVEVAKPAHTVFDVAFFWAAFRVGQARLGDDSIIDSSARAAFAMPPLMLSRGGLAQSYLASRNPVDACDGRQVIGQGNLGGETR